MAKSRLVETNEKIAEGVTDGYRKMEEGVVTGYRKIEEGVVDGYRKIEKGAVSGFNKIADRFVDNFLTKEGESVEEAKARLAAEQKAREAKSVAERRKGAAAEGGNGTDKQKSEVSGIKGDSGVENGRKAGLE